MKHRIFEFLVAEMGYRAFAIEAGFRGAQIAISIYGVYWAFFDMNWLPKGTDRISS